MKMSISVYIKRILFIALILSSLQGLSQTLPSCAALSVPANGSTDVALDINFEWIAAANTENYILIAGTASGATDILDNINVGNITNYDLPNNLPPGETIFVKIITENADDRNNNCAEISFSTTILQVPNCVALINPLDGSVDVPVDTAIEWLAASNSTGYRITIASFSGGNDIVDDMDVGNLTSFKLQGDYEPNSLIYIAIAPYNTSGLNTSCSEFKFTTAGEMLPRCTEIINPQDGAELVSVNANITWIRDFTATGYLMTIREDEIDGEFILNEENVGNGTNYKPPNFKPRTTYFVTMIPFNDQGNAEACEAIMFITGDPLPLPDCAEWVFPLDGSSDVSADTIFEWNEVPNTDGFLLSIGTSENGTDILNMEDVGDSTSYTLSEDLPIGATIFVQINTYKEDEISESCPSISFTIEGPEPLELTNEIPKFFTPNNDGFNDEWSVDSIENISINNIYIYNRYGQLLRQLNEGEGWNGTFKGKDLPATSYWYSIEVLNAPSIKGYFLLKR